jgi:DNA (cytosine-5)-methyltransferase 1
MTLVLSLFPGLGLLDRAFEQEGYCIVRGPDLIWGGDIKTFHPPAHTFSGVIGGPPCQMFSKLNYLVQYNGHENRFGNLIPEFARVCQEAQPDWFLMENVPQAPLPEVEGYLVSHVILDNRWFADTDGMGARQTRTRRWSFGTREGKRLVFDIALFEPSTVVNAVHGGTGGGALPSVGTSVGDLCVLQGLPRTFCEHMPFTQDAMRQAIGNGVPIAMGRAVARAVQRAIHHT